MNVLMPLPSRDFDLTEASVPFKILTENHVDVVIATPNGLPAHCDDRLRTGEGFGILASLMKANLEAQAAYIEMCQTKNYLNPLKWSEANAENFDAIILPGGHAPGMKEYLESEVLQKLVADFFAKNKLVAAICHGVLLAARSKNAKGESCLRGRKTTSLLASQELTAWFLTCFRLGSYYRTYPQTVEAEVKSLLLSPEDFRRGPLPIHRDGSQNLKPGFFVEDQNYLSARWPGDAHAFGQRFLKMLLARA